WGEASTKAQRPSASQAAMSQPKPAMLRRTSSAASSKVTKTPGWPAFRMPAARNWTANTVLALPAVPHSHVDRPRGGPPRLIQSKPSISVRSLSIPAGMTRSTLAALCAPAVGDGSQIEPQQNAFRIGKIADDAADGRRQLLDDRRGGQDLFVLG